MSLVIEDLKIPNDQSTGELDANRPVVPSPPVFRFTKIPSPPPPQRESQISHNLDQNLRENRHQNKKEKGPIHQHQKEMDFPNHRKAIQHLANKTDENYLLLESEMLKVMLDEDPFVLADYDNKILREVDSLLQRGESIFNQAKPHHLDPVYRLTDTGSPEEGLLKLKRRGLASRSSENLMSCLVAFDENWSALVASPSKLIETLRVKKKECVFSIVKSCFGKDLGENTFRTLTIAARESIRGRGEKLERSFEMAARHLVKRFNKRHGFEGPTEAKLFLLIDPEDQTRVDPMAGFKIIEAKGGEDGYETDLANVYSTLWFYSHHRTKMRDNNPYGSKEFVVFFAIWLLERFELGKPLDDNLLLRYWAERKSVPVVVYGIEKEIGPARKKETALIKVSEYIPYGKDPYERQKKTVGSSLIQTDPDTKCFAYLFHHRGLYDLLVYASNRKERVGIRRKKAPSFTQFARGTNLTKDEILTAVDLYRLSFEERAIVERRPRECAYCENHALWHETICIGNECHSVENRASLVVVETLKKLGTFNYERETQHVQSSSPLPSGSLVVTMEGSSTEMYFDPKVWTKLHKLNKRQLTNMFSQGMKKMSSPESLSPLDSRIPLDLYVNFGNQSVEKKSYVGMNQQFSETERKRRVSERLQGSESEVGGYWQKILYKSSSSDYGWTRASASVVNTEASLPQIKTFHFVNVERPESLRFSVFDCNGASFSLCEGVEVENPFMKSRVLETMFGHYERENKKSIRKAAEGEEEDQKVVISTFVAKMWNDRGMVDVELALNEGGEESNLSWKYKSKSPQSGVAHIGNTNLTLSRSNPLNWLGLESKFEDAKSYMVSHCGSLRYKKNLAEDENSYKSLDLSSILGLVGMGASWNRDPTKEDARSFSLGLTDLVGEEVEKKGSGWTSLLDGLGRTSLSCANLNGISLFNVGKVSPLAQKSWKMGELEKSNRTYWRTNETSWLLVPNDRKSERINVVPKPNNGPGDNGTPEWSVLGAAVDGALSFLEGVAEDWDVEKLESSGISNVVEELSNRGISPGKPISPEEGGGTSLLVPFHKSVVSVRLPVHSNALIIWSGSSLFKKEGAGPFVSESEEFLKSVSRTKTDEKESHWTSSWNEALEKATRATADVESKSSLWGPEDCYIVGGKVSGSSLPVTVSVPTKKIGKIEKETSISSMIGSFLGGKSEEGPNITRDEASTNHLGFDSESGPKYQLYGRLYIIMTHDILPYMVGDLLKPELKKRWEKRLEELKSELPEGSSLNVQEKFKLDFFEEEFPRNSVSVKLLCQHANDSMQKLYSFYSKHSKT